MFATPVAILSVPVGKVSEARDFKGIFEKLKQKKAIKRFGNLFETSISF
jgi:hypothetical protein